MRYAAEHKEETHERIVRAASRRFRRNGTGVGIGQLMTALKLTHGGFYRHFRSKDQLLAEAIGKAFDEGRAHLTAAIANAPAGQEVRAVIEGYLREENLSDTEGGCPLAALAPEIARQSLEVRRALDQSLLRNAAVLAPYMPGATDAERRGNVAALMSGMAGSLAMARAVSDETMGKRILEAARRLYIEAFCRR